MLTNRGRYALALGGITYLAGWVFGSEALYPVAIGLVAVVVGAALWVRILARPVALRRSIVGGGHVAGEDVTVRLGLQLAGRLPPGSLDVVERVDGLGERIVTLRRHERRYVGEYTLSRVPRGRYRFRSAEVVAEDPFAVERRSVDLAAPGMLLVYPRLVELERLFSETGSRLQEGRRILLRRPSGFDLHSVREHEQGESLRRVHWPSTARLGKLMVKDLEDAPRDETLVVLDAEARLVAGTPPDSSFELAVSAAGSILKAYARRGRRAALVVTGAEPRYQPVQTLEGDWGLALELLAAVEPQPSASVASLLAEGSTYAKALEVCVVTSGLNARLADRLLQRAVTRRGTSVVYVDATSFGERRSENQPPVDVRAQIARLGHGGIPVCVLRRGDDLASRLGSAWPAVPGEIAVG